MIQHTNYRLGRYALIHHVPVAHSCCVVRAMDIVVAVIGNIVPSPSATATASAAATAATGGTAGTAGTRTALVPATDATAVTAGRSRLADGVRLCIAAPAFLIRTRINSNIGGIADRVLVLVLVLSPAWMGAVHCSGIGSDRTQYD